MNWKNSTLFLAILFLVAPTAHASVLINEVAWMGGVDSSTDEWIELYNPDASAVDMTGWRIIADDGSPMIVLSGVISAGEYFLIERTDDNSVVSVTADLIAPFGNGLGNAGETLRLKNASDADIDVVVGGTDWANVGGDNTTKQTAQRTANSWVTGVPTPRAQNVAQGGEVEGVSTTTIENTTTTGTGNTTSTNSSSGGVNKPSLYPRANIVVEAGSDMRGFVGFPMAFHGSSTGLFNEPLGRATYRWNFGDGSTGEGQTQSHDYDFPGEYLVTLEVFWGGQHAQDRLSVVVVSPDVAVVEFVSGQMGYIRLKNNSEREIDLLGWSLRGVTGGFVFPPNTIILPKKTFTISNKISGTTDATALIGLYFPNGELASQWRNMSVSTGVVAGARDVRTSVAPPTAQSAKPQSVGVAVKSAVVSDPVAKSHMDTTATSSVAATLLWEKSGNVPSDSFLGGTWVFALLAVMLVILVGFMLMRAQRGEPTIDEEYAIIEDIIEGKEDLLAK